MIVFDKPELVAVGFISYMFCLMDVFIGLSYNNTRE
jgi:hypothetical protein